MLDGQGNIIWAEDWTWLVDGQHVKTKVPLLPFSQISILVCCRSHLIESPQVMDGSHSGRFFWAPVGSAIRTLVTPGGSLKLLRYSLSRRPSAATSTETMTALNPAAVPLCKYSSNSCVLLGKHTFGSLNNLKSFAAILEEADMHHVRVSCPLRDNILRRL